MLFSSLRGSLLTRRIDYERLSVLVFDLYVLCDGLGPSGPHGAVLQAQADRLGFRVQFGQIVRIVPPYCGINFAASGIPCAPSVSTDRRFISLRYTPSGFRYLSS